MLEGHAANRAGELGRACGCFAAAFRLRALPSAGGAAALISLCNMRARQGHHEWCAHALLRRALLHQVDIDQPQGLELPPVLLDLTQAVLQGMATVRGCTVMGEVSGLRGTVGAPPCFRIACG